MLSNTKVEIMRLFGENHAIAFVVANEDSGLWVSLRNVALGRVHSSTHKRGWKYEPMPIHAVEDKMGGLWVIHDESIRAWNRNYVSKPKAPIGGKL